MFKDTKCIVIDAENETVTAVKLNGDYREIYRVGGFDCFDSVRIDQHNVIYVDDEGLLHDPKHFFMFRGYPQPLAGRGVVLGVDDAGESIPTTWSVEEIKSDVKFSHNLRVAGFDTSEEKGDVLGKPGVIMRSTPVFREEPDE